jgi:quercetin dioxygenase-like cupin family protein
VSFFPVLLQRLFTLKISPVAHVQILKDAVVPEHSHIHEQIINIIEGTFELTVGSETKTVSAGHVAVVPSNIKHSLVAVTGGKILDVFYPVREDLK